jgi:hypothetical protein
LVRLPVGRRVTRITFAIVVGIRLSRVGNIRTVVIDIRDSVVIGVILGRCAIACITLAIVVGIRLSVVGFVGAVILGIRYTVVVVVGL